MKNSDNKTVEITIVNYNAGQHLLDCIASIEKIKDEAKITVTVIDNASSDDSMSQLKRKFPWVNCILNKDNLGFGKAHNQALSVSKAEYILILNPDIIIEKGILATLLDYMEENPDVGAITPKIVFENGKLDLTAHRGFPTPWASLKYLLGDDSLYHLSTMNLETVHEVDAITGAFLLTKNEILKKVGLFDEDYFMYAEDIDLCYRIKQAGYKVIYYPKVEVLHYKGVSSGLKKRSLNWFYKTMIIFYDKHYKSQYPFFITWLVYLGIHLRWWLAKRKLTV